MHNPAILVQVSRIVFHLTKAAATLNGPIFVTGTNGCLGRSILTGLISRNGVSPKQIHAFSLRAPADEARIDGVIYYQGDISVAHDVNAAISKAKPEVVIHTAGINGLLGNEESYIRVNVGGTKNVVFPAQEAGFKAFVFTSSASVVDDGYINLVAVDETQPILDQLQYEDVYNFSKAQSEEITLAANRFPSMLTISLQVSSLFGPGDNIGTQKKIEAAKENKLRYQISPNKGCVTMVFVENAADCHILASKVLLAAHGKPGLPIDEHAEGEAFFLTNGESMPFWTFSRKLGDSAGYRTDPESIIVIPTWLALPGATVVD